MLGQKREHEWWLEGSAIRRAMKIEMEKSLNESSETTEFFSTSNPDESQSLNDYMNTAKSDPFPFALNPGFDLFCLVLVIDNV